MQQASQSSWLREGLAKNKNRIKFSSVSPFLWRIIIITMACSLFYYSPTIAQYLGWITDNSIFHSLHDFYGIDFYAIVFFVPVVYAAYMLGVIAAALTALFSMLILFPQALLIATDPAAIFRPTAFAIILSAVGAVIAMIQKSDEQRHRNMLELKCLYDMGKTAEESDSINDFMSSVVNLIADAVKYREESMVRINFRGKQFQNQDFKETDNIIKEDLLVSNEMLGNIEIYSTRSGSFLNERYPFIKTLTKRISNAVHEIELQNSLKEYYGQQEEMVEKRTRDLEKAQEKLIRSERLAAVGELASGVGHELRNPLNVIKNCVYLMNLTLEDKADEETLSTLKLVDQQVEISNRIVTDLLDFTRVRKPSLAGIELNKLVKESLSWIVMPKHVSVVDELNGNKSRIMVDAEQVGRAFANVISNAIQSISGEGKLTIKSDVAGDSAWVSFKDTGCGIPEENLARIFEPLYTTKSKGIGLGLPIMKRLIEQNGGAINIKSKEGQGTTLTITLPLEQKQLS